MENIAPFSSANLLYYRLYNLHSNSYGQSNKGNSGFNYAFLPPSYFSDRRQNLLPRLARFRRFHARHSFKRIGNP